MNDQNLKSGIIILLAPPGCNLRSVEEKLKKSLDCEIKDIENKILETDETKSLLEPFGYRPSQEITMYDMIFTTCLRG